MVASILGISRLRIGTDGNGITSLVAFHGCSLRCQYCLNPSCLNPEAKVRRMTPEKVMKELKKDELYYIATKGGVTFGGGEPLLNSSFIKGVLDLGTKEWNVTVETSLNVPRQHLELLIPYIDEYIVDIKDMDLDIYKRYTYKNNELVKSNLKWLIDKGLEDHILCRIPLIPGYNDKTHQEKSREELTNMGISRFDLFTYKTGRDDGVGTETLIPFLESTGDASIAIDEEMRRNIRRQPLMTSVESPTMGILRDNYLETKQMRKEEERQLKKAPKKRKSILDSIRAFFSPSTTGIIPLKEDEKYMNSSWNESDQKKNHTEKEDSIFNDNMADPLFKEAARLIVKEQIGSTSLIQRRLGIGYNRASRIMDELEKAGVVSHIYNSRPRDVLIQDETSIENLLAEFCTNE